MRGEVEPAIACAHDSRHGHGGMFADMCERFVGLGAPLGGLSDVLFDCMVRYHEGHGSCSAWTLLLLFDQGHAEQFEQGLTRMAACAGDYRLNLEQRRSLAAAVTAAKLHRAQRMGDVERTRQLRQQIAAMPFFGCDLGRSLYRHLGFAKARST